MFASVLPGVRELRTPLAVGFLWLLIAWLIWGRFLPSEESADGVVDSLYQLFDVLGVAALLAAISFAAYLVGIFLSYANFSYINFQSFAYGSPVYFSGRRPLLLGRATRTKLDLESETLLRTFDHVVTTSDLTVDQLEEVRRAFSDDLSPSASFRRRSHRFGFNTFLQDAPQTAMRIHMLGKDLWDDYERPQAEGEFRSAIAIPTGIVAGIVFHEFARSSTLPLEAAIAATVATALETLSRQKYRESYENLYGAVRAHGLKSPVEEMIAAFTADNQPARSFGALFSRVTRRRRS